MKHTDIVRDILNIHVPRGSDSRVWGNSVSGQLTSRMAYDILRSPNPRVNCLLFTVPRFAFFVTSILSHWITFLLTAHLLLVFYVELLLFLQATRVIFDEAHPSEQRYLAFITASVKEANLTALGHFSSSVRELLILGHLGLSGRPQPPTSTTVIRWKPPQAGWYKVNVDGSAPFSPRPIFAEAIFHNSRGFFVAAFTKAVGWGFPLEAELAAILHVILFTFDYGWHSLWVESDSILAI
ncbi:hypothetical protein ACS0TY_010831 [Phlomoides rotata]